MCVRVADCGTLSDEIEKGRESAASSATGCLAKSRMLELSAQIARAVAELAACRIVIQDLKPSNLLLNTYGDVVVSDFGLSSQLETSLSRLMLSHIRGTPNYMSPEQFDPAHFGGIGTPADIWALGCCMIEMLDGRPPWNNAQHMFIARTICDKKKHPAIPACASPEVRALIRACFAYAPRERILADELRDQLAIAAAKALARPGPHDGTSFEDVPPAQALCSLSRQLMAEPVRASDGYVYEREVIALWLRNHATSPMTRGPISPTELVAEKELQAAIMSWMAEQHSSASETESGAPVSGHMAAAAVRAAQVRWLEWAGFPEAATLMRSAPLLETQAAPAAVGQSFRGSMPLSVGPLPSIEGSVPSKESSLPSVESTALSQDDSIPSMESSLPSLGPDSLGSWHRTPGCNVFTESTEFGASGSQLGPSNEAVDSFDVEYGKAFGPITTGDGGGS